MKALSIKQPWAWAIIHAGKDVENRTWPTKKTGRLLVHASRAFDMPGWLWSKDNAERLGISEVPDVLHFQRGGIIGEVTLVKCRMKSESPWFTGPYGFFLKDPEPMEFRPCKGRLGFFEVTT